MTISSNTPSLHGEAVLPRQRVAEILAAQQESCRPESIGYYDSIASLAEKTRSSTCWAMGEVFVYAEHESRFVVMKQIAPDSCEMLIVTSMGCMDVLTACAFSQEELVATLEQFMQQCVDSAEEGAGMFEGEWDHLFGPCRQATRCRIVLDANAKRVVAAQTWTGLKFVTASESMRADIEDSVINANEAHLDPSEFALDPCSELPDWACAEVHQAEAI